MCTFLQWLVGILYHSSWHIVFRLLMFASALTNFNLSSCRFNKRGFLFGLDDFQLFLSISLLIVRLVTLHSDKRKSSCSSLYVTIGFWLIRHPNFLDNLGEIFLGAHVLFLFSNVLCLLNLAMNELIVVKGIFRLLEIFL